MAEFARERASGPAVKELLHDSRRSPSDAGDELFNKLPGIDYQGLAPALGEVPLAAGCNCKRLDAVTSPAW